MSDIPLLHFMDTAIALQCRGETGVAFAVMAEVEKFASDMKFEVIVDQLRKIRKDWEQDGEVDLEAMEWVSFALVDRYESIFAEYDI